MSDFVGCAEIKRNIPELNLKVNKSGAKRKHENKISELERKNLLPG